MAAAPRTVRFISSMASPANTALTRRCTSRPSCAVSIACMFANEDRLRRYVEAGLVEGEGTARPAHRLSEVPTASWTGRSIAVDIQQALGLDPTRPTVLYAPTWSAFSSLNSVGADLLSRLGQLDVNVIVKLHDRSFDARSQRAASIDWRREFESLCRDRGACTRADERRHLALPLRLRCSHHRSQLRRIRIHAARSADCRHRLPGADSESERGARQGAAAAECVDRRQVRRRARSRAPSNARWKIPRRAASAAHAGVPHVLQARHGNRPRRPVHLRRARTRTRHQSLTRRTGLLSSSRIAHHA